MAVYKPSSHTPNLQEVDLNEMNDFTCLVNTSGEQIKAYKMTILSENGSEIIADGHWATNNIPQYVNGAVDLIVPLNNKKTLKIPNVSKDFHMENQLLENGKNYQWGVRTYTAKVGSVAQPTTKICEGYLVGSTKYVIWSKIPKDQVSILDQIVYDRYIEFTVNNANELIIGAHESKSKQFPTNYPYTQRKKIDWVTKELGINEDFLKIETTEDFDYDYLDGKEYQIYQCSSDHTIKSLFADPNTNINITNVVIVYKTVANAKAARASGETPNNIKDTSKWADCMKKSDGISYGERKIVGYSSDTGEMRFNDSFYVPPINNQCYRLFKLDVSTNNYIPVDEETADKLDTHIVGGTPITNSVYFKTISNKWDTAIGDNTIHRLFIQPNIVIKSDGTNPDEIVFENGVRINIVEQYWINNDQKIDISLNKLDNTQWLLEDNSKNISGKSVTDGLYVPSGATVPVIPQTNYAIYSDFADSMPYNVFYARTAPKIKLQFRNALREIRSGFYNAEENEFYDGMGNKIPKSEFYLYYQVPDSNYREGAYFLWVTELGVEQYKQIYNYLVEGYYLNGSFYEDSEGQIQCSKTEDNLYYDINGYKYYAYSSNTDSFNETEQSEVVWVDVDSNITRDYREVEFRVLWLNELNELMINPQVKNYQFSLSSYLSNDNTMVELIKQSNIEYSTDIKWVFRGLDGTSPAYSMELPHIYKVSVLITDEYDKEYIINSDFKIYYETEGVSSPINVSLLCDEQANEINISPPGYAQSTDYEGRPTVTEISEGRVVIPDGYTLNYNQTTNGQPLNFSQDFTALTKIKLTEEFVDKHYGENEEAELMVINHDLSSNSKEDFVYKLNLSMGYYINPVDNKIYKKSDSYHIKLYNKVDEGEMIQVHDCFDVQGHLQDYVNLLDPATPSSEEDPVNIVYAVQDNLDNRYIIKERLPEISTISVDDLDKKFVTSEDTLLNNKLYPAGVYKIYLYPGGSKEWIPIIDEDYVYITNTNNMGGEGYNYNSVGIKNNSQVIPSIINGIKRSNSSWEIDGRIYDLVNDNVSQISYIDNTTFIYYDITNNIYYSWNGIILQPINNYSSTQGQINFYDDNNTTASTNYIWLDEGWGQERLKYYLKDKTLIIFLRVQYNEFTNTRRIKSQIKLIGKNKI